MVYKEEKVLVGSHNPGKVRNEERVDSWIFWVGPEYMSVTYKKYAKS